MPSSNSSQNMNSTGTPKQTLRKPMIQGITAATTWQKISTCAVLRENLLNRMKLFAHLKKIIIMLIWGAAT